MAINRIAEPANPPTAIGDWTQAIALIRALASSTEIPLRVVGSNVAKGAVFYIGGTLYQADGDTAITGSASNYVKLTPSGDGSTVAAAFVASLTGVTWNSTYCGYYDASGNLYVFDEWKAYTAGAIASIRRDRDVAVPMGTGWLAALAVNIASGWASVFSVALGANWQYALSHAMGTNWGTTLATALGTNWPKALAASAGAGILAQLLTVDGAGSSLDADKLDGLHASESTISTVASRTAEGRIYGPIAPRVAFYGPSSSGDVFSALAPFIPTNGMTIIVNGFISIGTVYGTIAYATRQSSTEIRIFCHSGSTTVTFAVSTSGSSDPAIAMMAF